MNTDIRFRELLWIILCLLLVGYVGYLKLALQQEAISRMVGQSMGALNQEQKLLTDRLSDVEKRKK